MPRRDPLTPDLFDWQPPQVAVSLRRCAEEIQHPDRNADGQGAAGSSERAGAGFAGQLEVVEMSSGWKTAAEWAALSLEGMPKTKSGYVRLAKREEWQCLGDSKARKRRESGGGWEYHVSCLPEAAQRDYRNRLTAETANAELAERAATDVAVVERAATDLRALQRRVMEARAAVLREVDRAGLYRADQPSQGDIGAGQ